MNESFYQESLSSAETTGGFTPGRLTLDESPPPLALRIATENSSSVTIGTSGLSLNSLSGAPPSTPVLVPTSETPRSDAPRAFPPSLKAHVTVDDILKRKPVVRHLKFTPETVAGFQEVLKAFQRQDFFYVASQQK
jgi:hypothetical protein